MEFPEGKRNGLGLIDIDIQLLVNVGEVGVGVGGTMINIAVPEHNFLSGASE